MVDDKILLAYKTAYEKANNKKLVITFTTEYFYIEDLPYRISKMPEFTRNLNEKILRKSKENLID